MGNVNATHLPKEMRIGKHSKGVAKNFEGLPKANGEI
jgi:hypothetical protein